MKSAEIRETFLSYFEQQQHTRVASSSLVLENDPSLLFANAGMNQFKNVFLGLEQRPYVRACTSQCCVRAGGKHNDLENIGYTARHHSFFEMLGNFSFGDYFKREAIGYCWEFLTEHLGLPVEKLWVTVHVSDDEAADIWLNEIGVSPSRFSRLDEDNFWQMGDTGPCGPCSEVFFDHGAEVPGGPPGTETDGLDRYVELWNLVFMQYNRDSDGSMQPLPTPSVDTGMGLERLAAVLQGVRSNYETDVFQNLIRAVAESLNLAQMEDNSLQVISDHIRSCSFLIADGVMPGNEGRGYALRRIIRRAIRHGHKLGAQQPFFSDLVAPLAREMGAAYPQLIEQRSHIEKVLLGEEQQFAKTLDKGLGILDQALAELHGSEIPGELVFKLYDTYGFPVDLTNDIARERELTLDLAGYEDAMAEQRLRSQSADSFALDYNKLSQWKGSTRFDGYEQLLGEGRVRALLLGDRPVEELSPGDAGTVILDQTPFYAESGGQVGDTGYLLGAGKFAVRDTSRGGDQYLHHGVVLEGTVRVGDVLRTEVDHERRGAIARNHSATHLLHAALRSELGNHVIQKGSLVDSEHLRFDFSHPQALTATQLHDIEQLVNLQIRGNSPVCTRLMDMTAAIEAGALALFGEKYDEQVRVLSMGDGFSVELCGGTHVGHTGDIGLLRITAETGIAAGIRRIEAVTGAAAMQRFVDVEQQLSQICELLKATPGNVAAKVADLRSENRELEKRLASLKQKLADSTSADLVHLAVEVGDTKVLAAAVDGADDKSLRETIDQLKNKLGSSVILLAAVQGDKVNLSAGVSTDVSERVPAGDLMKEFAGRLGGRGGGRAGMAQGGGNDVNALPKVLKALPEWVENRLRGV